MEIRRTKLLLAACFIVFGIVFWFFYQNMMNVKKGEENQRSNGANATLNQSAIGNVVTIEGILGSNGLNVLTNDNTLERQNDLDALKPNLTPAELEVVAEQYKKNVDQIEEAQAVLAETREALLNNAQILKRLEEEWSRHALQINGYENGKQSAQAAANYELANTEEVETLLDQLKHRASNEKPDYPTGMAPQVVNRVQETTGISSAEIENLMNQ